MRRIDIHSHILPGLDDGAQNEKESLEMFRIAAKDNIREMIMTPHLGYRRGDAAAEKIRKLTVKMQEYLNEEQIPIQIYSGNELYYYHDLLERVKAGEALTLADSDYVLLEFSYGTEKRKIQNAVYQFLSEGYYPIIAHVERYQAFRKDPDFGKTIADMGAYLQINVDCFNRIGNLGTRHYARIMLKNRRIHFIATDAHDERLRMPQLGKAAKWLEKKYGRSEVTKIFYKNPQCILENRAL